MPEQLPFRIRRSAVEGKRPQNADLELGELALNTFEGRLFAKKDTGGVGIGTTVALLTPWTETVGVGIYYNEGNVGLGTTNPTTKLFVSGDINFTGNLYQNGNIFQSGGGGGTSSQWVTYAAGISTTSNVGIGTTNPTSKLQINGSVTLGTGSTDLISIPGRISSNFYPDGDGVYDVGRAPQIGSGANRWKDANFTGKGTFDSGVNAHDLELGVSSANLIYSTSGNLELNSQSGTTNIDDNVTISGNTGIGTVTPTSKLHVVGDGRFTGVVTATTFTGNLTGTATTATSLSDAANITTGTISSSRLSGSYGISITGTATTATNLSDAANITTGTISSSRLSGTYGIDIIGTATTANNLSNAANITTGTISSSRLTGSYGISITGTATTATNLADAANITTGTINKDRITTTNALTVLGDLYVSNNISFGGTTTQLNLQQLQIVDADIVLGIGTSFSPTDNTANHGGIAIASTEGTPLVSLNIVPGETNPYTYKKIMWFKGSTIGAGLTDAWLFNYGVGIGSTQVPNGVRLAVGGIQMTDSAITATTFTGNLTGTATTATNLYNAANITTGTISSSRLSGTYGIDITGTATTATNLSNAANITTGTISSSRLTGSYGISITGTATTATNLTDAANITTGTISSSRLSGTYGIDITGTATTATNLSNAANITTGTISSSRLTGSYGIDITGTATTATNLSNASNITTGTISSSRLSGTYGISITGTATTATNLTDAANITTGTISSSRLSGTYGISITGTATTATNLTDAANITTGTISSSRLTGSYGISITGTATTATTALGFSTTASINTSGIITAFSFIKSSGTSSQFLKADGSVDSNTYLTTTGSGTALTGIVTSIVAGTGITISGSTGQVTINASASGGSSSQWTTYPAGISTTSNVGIGTTNPIYSLDVAAIQIRQDAGSNNRIVLRGTPGSVSRWSIDNFQSGNTFRIFREDDITAANGSVAVSISTTGTLTATKFSGDGSLLTGITASGSGVVIQNQGSNVGTAGTINFSTNLTASFSSGTATISLSNNPSISGILTADQVYTSNNGNGQNVRIGDDFWLGDVNVANTTRFSGAQDSTKAFIIFGSSDAVALGRTGTGPLYYGGNFTSAGIITASQLVSNVAQGTAPITVGSSTLVTNLNANYLNGQTSSYYTNASNLSSGTVPSTRITASSGDFTVGNNLFVTGTLSIGGSSVILNATQVQIKDKDIVVGYTTDPSTGADISNDDTANHGGIAVASTVGSPLINIPLQVGINSNPSTYKQLMWIKAGNYSGWGTDSWLTNYPISIGTTVIQNNSRLTVGSGFTVYDTYLDTTDIKARNINATGIITASSFSGNASSATYATTAGIATYATSSGISTYATNAGVSTSVIGGIASVTQLSVSGISTFSGITTHTELLFGTQASFTGIVTASSFVGNLSGNATSASLINASAASANFVYSPVLVNVTGVNTIPWTDTNLIWNPSTNILGIGTTAVSGTSNQNLQVYGGAYIKGNIGLGVTTPAYAVDTTGTIRSTWTPTNGVPALWASGTTLQTNSKTGTAVIGTLISYNDKSMLLTAADSQNAYVQVVLQNTNSGVNASSDFVVNNDVSSVNDSYLDLGMNGSGYSASPAYAFDTPGGAYLYATSVWNANGTSVTTPVSFAIGTQDSGDVIIATGSVGSGLPSQTFSGLPLPRITVKGLTGLVGIGSTQPTSTLTVTGNALFNGTGIITASQLISNVAQGTAPITVGSSTLVTNLNANYLNGQPDTYYTNAGNLTGTISSSRLSGTYGISITGTATTATTSNNVSSTININTSGIITATELDLTGNAATDNSILYLSGAPLGTSTKNGLLGIGQLNFSDTDIVADFTHNVNSYAQVILQNKNSGASASSDFIVNNDRTAGTTYYGDFGINGTTFSGGGPFGDPDGTYLYSAGGTLAVGTNDAKDFRIATGSTTATPVTRMTITGIGGSVGVGTTLPSQSLHVQGNVRITGGLYDFNNNVGTAGSVLSSTGSGLSWIAAASGSSNVSISTNTTNQSQYLTYVTGTGSTTGLGVSTTGLVFNPSTSNFGIGTATPTSTLHVVGGVLVTGVTTSTDFNSSSDINLKNNIQRIENPIDKVLQLDGVTFNWKSNQRPSVGVIAQQVEKVLPQLVSGEYSKTVNYNGLIGLLIEAIKEQQKEIEVLKKYLNK